MKTIKSIIGVFILGICIVSCSSTKKTAESSSEEDKQEKTTSTETNTIDKAVKGGTTATEETSKDTGKETATKGDQRENILKEAIASYPDSLVTLIQRTACYGKCPVYTVKIYASGYATYEGKMNVEMEGSYSGIFTADEIKTLGKKIDEMKFFDLKNIYDTQVTDFPSLHIYANRNGNKKQVIDRQGGPQELKDYAAYIDELVKAKEWKK